MLAKEMPPGTKIKVPAERLTLTLQAHGKKPWRTAAGQYRFSHDQVQASLDAGEAEVITAGDAAVAVV
jgi:hypothetical protein